MMYELWASLTELLRGRDIIWTLTLRDLNSRYAGSMGGFIWAYLQPLLTMAAYMLVFDVVLAMRMDSESGASRAGVYLVVGMLPWLAFAEGVSRAASSLVENGGLLQKNSLPLVLFVVRSILTSAFVYGPLLMVLALGFVIFGGVDPVVMLIMPMVMFMQGLLMYLLGHVLAILVAALRDIIQFLAFALSVGVFLSPILFPISKFPQGWHWLLYANPMTALVQIYQELLLQGLWPDPELVGITLIWMVSIATLLGSLLKRSHDQLVDWL